MNSEYAFTIYNASAGAGKTYTLVQQYIITLLKGEYNDSYKNILAITFTNKAVTEMKSRVLQTLVAVSDIDTPISYKQLVTEITRETGLEEDTLKQKAKRILRHIIHNYAAFDIVTIDTFTHRVIRTFARDLGIPMNFEIEMDTEALIEESVDALIAKIGTDKTLTKVIIDFALTKLEDDKSWDITRELNTIGRLLFNENDRMHLDKLFDKSTDDFEGLKKVLSEKSNELKKEIRISSKAILDQIHTRGLDHKDFTRSSIPTHFQKLADGDITADFKATWKQNIKETNFYNKTLDSQKKESIDAIRLPIEETFVRTKKQLYTLKLYKNVIHNIIPLSVLHAINNELQEIKKERNILLISEFNKIISKAIQNQPAPFVYERLGERYIDYFIDEFQDTSELQWKNIIPLIDNALAGETLTGKRGHLTIVGDAKQAIYRWRGGKAEQFINLTLDKNPFSIKEKQVLNLPKNYRSYDTVINFNNDLFTFLSTDFSKELHQKLYISGNRQESNDKRGGYVNISFIEAKTVTEEHQIYPQKVYETIVELQRKKYQLNDICIVTRKQKEGAMIADYLTEKGIAIISSETLLLKNDPRIQFIIDLLTYCAFNDDLMAKTNALHFIADQYVVDSKHSFLKKMVFANKKTCGQELLKFGIDFNFINVDVKPFYDTVEYIISSFNLANSFPAYLQFFLDIVFEYTQKHSDGIIGFLSYWKYKKDKESIIAPDEVAAVRIMTIHKSKGLEFPCVIYPYANIDIYKEIEPKTWLGVDKLEFNDFEEVLINYNKEIANFGVTAENIVANRQSQLELDMLNLLYVALTRAQAQLYIISKMDLTSKGVSYSNKFSGKLINYLNHIGKWDATKTSYDFGDQNAAHQQTDKITTTKRVLFNDFDTITKKYKVHIATQAGKLWDTSLGAAIEKGNLIHDILATIHTSDDLDPAITNAIEMGLIAITEKESLHNELKKILNHPELSKYYTYTIKVMNEKEIISKGKIYRPDRIIIDQKEVATIIDYKTGEYAPIHAKQLKDYGKLLQELGYKIQHKILVYINENINLEYV